MKLFRIIYTGAYIICITLLLALGCKSKDKPVTKYGSVQDSITFKLDDTSGYIHFAEDTAGQRARTKYYVDSIVAVITGDGVGGVTSFTDSGFGMTATSGFKRVHHKKKLTDWSKFVSRYGYMEVSRPDTSQTIQSFPVDMEWRSRNFDETGNRFHVSMDLKKAGYFGILSAYRDSTGHWVIEDRDQERLNGSYREDSSRHFK